MCKWVSGREAKPDLTKNLNYPNVYDDSEGV
jgi:hypothetical protein